MVPEAAKENRRLGCGDGARLARFWAQRRIVNSGRYCEQDKIRCGVDAVTSQGVNCSVGATHALPNGAFRAALVWSGLDVWLHGYRGMSLGFRSRSFPRLPESVDGLGAEMNLLLNIFWKPSPVATSLFAPSRAFYTLIPRLFLLSLPDRLPVPSFLPTDESTSPLNKYLLAVLLSRRRQGQPCLYPRRPGLISHPREPC